MSQGLEQKLALCQGCKARVHHFRICLTTVRDERTETLPVSTQAAALAQARQQPGGRGSGAEAERRTFLQGQADCSLEKAPAAQPSGCCL